MRIAKCVGTARIHIDHYADIGRSTVLVDHNGSADHVRVIGNRHRRQLRSLNHVNLGRLNAAVGRVIWYPIFEKLFQLQPQENVLKAASKLLDLALDDADFDEDVSAGRPALATRDEIRRLLRLRSPYAEQ
jgi:hypothetical protein